MRKNAAAGWPVGVTDQLFNDTHDLPVAEAARVAQSHFIEVVENLERLLEPGRERNGALKVSSHPNGFTKIELHKREQRTIRLHLWTSPSSENEARIHGHAWSMASLVLRGSIIHTLFQETSAPEGEPYHRYWYTPGTSDGAHTMSYDDRTNLVSTGTTSVESKQTYGMEQKEIHSSIATRFQTATLMFADRGHSESLVPVYSKKYFPDGYAVARTAPSEI